jgi:molybdenum cofactor cytidylyltransferase
LSDAAAAVGAPSGSTVGAVILAAGGSSRMGAINKLLEPLHGIPVLAHVVAAAVSAGARPVVVVTGHEAERVRNALSARDALRSVAAGSAVELVHNPRWREGMSTSIVAGVSAIEGRVDGALICLGDMPRVRADDLAALIRAMRSHPAGPSTPLPAAYVPVFEGRWGNPVLWTAKWFGELRGLRGDRGARTLLERLGPGVVTVPAGEGVLLDADTPEALDQLRGGAASDTTTPEGRELP